MLELWGLDTTDAMIGRNIRSFLCSDETADSILQAISRRMAWEQELDCETESGTPFYTRVSVAPNVTDDEELTGMVLSLLDITDLKLATKQLEQVLNELKRSNQDLQQFAYAVSHDLQAPLRKLTTFAGMIEADTETPLTPPISDYLQRIKHAANRMTQLIQGLLRYSRVSTREKVYEPLNLNATIADVLSDLEPAILDTEGRVNVATLPDIAAEPTQMRQLFQNLIANALKFTRPDIPPVIDITSERLEPNEDDDTARYEIAVQDNGIGFPAKDAERIFGVFQRLHSQTDFEGTGIGLAICRKIVERHGGQLTASSTEGKGACFRIVLPERGPHEGKGAPRQWST
jgi:light-regulated signal transduction histidine kinase (bacteriophytochrome)